MIYSAASGDEASHSCVCAFHRACLKYWKHKPLGLCFQYFMLLSHPAVWFIWSKPSGNITDFCLRVRVRADFFNNSWEHEVVLTDGKLVEWTALVLPWLLKDIAYMYRSLDNSQAEDEFNGSLASYRHPVQFSFKPCLVRLNQTLVRFFFDQNNHTGTF